MACAPSGVVPSPEALAAGGAASPPPPPDSPEACASEPEPESVPVPTRTTSSTFSVTVVLDRAVRETSVPPFAVTSYVVWITPSTPSVSTLVSPLGRVSVSFSIRPCASVLSSVTV